VGLATSICFSSHISTSDTLVLLISHQQRSQFVEDTIEPSYLPGINSLFMVCIGIIRNNSLVGGLARALAWSPASGHWAHHVYFTWRLSALTIRPDGQVCFMALKCKNCNACFHLNITDFGWFCLQVLQNVSLWKAKLCCKLHLSAATDVLVYDG